MSATDRQTAEEEERPRVGWVNSGLEAGQVILFEHGRREECWIRGFPARPEP